jgi:hypothetical protein
MRSTMWLFALLGAAALCEGCLWRPPPIPPARAGADGAAPPGSFSDEAACEAATQANDGSTTIAVFNNGRVVNCAALADASATRDGATDDAATDASADTSEDRGPIDDR